MRMKAAKMLHVCIKNVAHEALTLQRSDGPIVRLKLRMIT